MTSALTAILDPNSIGPHNQLLRSIAPYLHLHRIDTVLGNAVSLKPSKRARIAPLEGYHATGTDWNSILPAAWAQAFGDGLVGVIIAVKSATPKNLQSKQTECEKPVVADQAVCDFVNNWLKADKDKRIFVAFTRSDVDSASIVKSALEAQGYVVFIFLRPGFAAPWADPGLVGEVFAQASHRLVIDTENSRTSDGVALESKLCEFLLEGQPPASKWQRMISSEQ